MRLPARGASMAGGRGAGPRLTRGQAAVAAAAAILMAFSGWSLSQYLQGKDPLSFLGAGALSTTQEALEGQGGSAAPRTLTVSGEDVRHALAGLSLEGRDLSLDPEQLQLVLSSRVIWVEQRSSDASADMMDVSVRRAFALARWVQATGAPISQVTWIVEDASGAVRLVLSVPASLGELPSDTPGLLALACGYQVSADAYAALESPSFARTGGDLPTLPDGAAIEAPAAVTPEGERLSDVSQERSQAMSQGGVLSSGAGGSFRSGVAGAGDVAGSQVSVSVTVDGTAAGANASSATLLLPAGSTAFDALVATGVDVSSKGTAFGTYVMSINGLAEFDHGGMSGWVYRVNGVEPNVACSNYQLSSGDSLVWAYVNVTE